MEVVLVVDSFKLIEMSIRRFDVNDPLALLNNQKFVMWFCSGMNDPAGLSIWFWWMRSVVAVDFEEPIHVLSLIHI